MTSGDLRIRRATEPDLGPIIEVAAAALGWAPGEAHEALFRWKHLESPFGPSPMWVAEDGDRLAGFRAFMRWDLCTTSGETVRAVRAVDTATHPDYQRRGIFSTLTSQAVEEVTDDGLDIVFNTPNDQSRPGYLKLGWVDVGRLPVAMRPTSVGSAVRMTRSRVPAAKWSTPSTLGLPAAVALADPDISGLVPVGVRAGLATALSPEYLRWRYGLEELHYRAWAPEGIAGGLVIFRLRRRGRAMECAVGQELVPDGDPHRRRSLLRGLARTVPADYLLTIGDPDWRVGLFPVPGQGPRLTVRSLASDPPDTLGGWSFSLGDIELF